MFKRFLVGLLVLAFGGAALAQVGGGVSSSGAVSVAVSSITGLGTGIATALGINVGSAGAPVVNGGALGTPSSGNASNLTNIPGAPIASAFATISGGAITVQKQSGFTSITRSTTGKYVATMSSAASDANYRVHVTCQQSGSNGEVASEDTSVQARSTTQFGISNNSGSGSYADCAGFSVTVFP